MAQTIGSYNGTPIYAGTDAEIQAQIAKIDAGKKTTSNVNAFDIPSTSYYGYKPIPQTKALDVSKTINAASTSGMIDPSFMSKIASDPNVMAFYINAMTYGGYTTGDVLNDMKRRELISQGNVDAKNMKALISPDMERKKYILTSDGQNAMSKASEIIPTFNLQGVMDPNTLNYGSNMPDDLFKSITPLLDRNSQEFKNAVANVKSAFYDLANQQLQAETEQQKAAADYNYEKFKEQINTQYGLLLSDDATKAWKQIEDLENSNNTRGLLNSGIHNEAVDETLKATRKQDQRLRQEKITKEEAQMAATYAASATPAQIRALIAEDQAKGLPKSEWRATKWGLTPSDEIASQYNMDSLRAKYPDSTEEELKRLRDSVLDENGNYRSSIYSKYYSGVSANKVAQKEKAEETVYNDALNKEAREKQAYDTTQVLNVQPSGPGSYNPTNLVKDTNLTKASDAAANMSSGMSNTTTTSTPKPTPTPTPTAPKQTTTPSASNGYTIAYGDTLGALAAKNKTTVQALAKLNNISDPNKIKAGQVIKFQ